ncbi:hypothetical protein VB773_14890 [Haloarculaceae archaeon H-GB2-1]|nr:hypothetical protein [Haloarculaceae archaeon H-GB1-1]MEA5408721.1 hypothetical protein [Haloarculaceae archaeon H-GB2-1]
MAPNYIEKIIVKSHNPKWGKVAVSIGVLSGLAALIFSNPVGKIVSIIIGLIVLSINYLIPKLKSGIQITCVQTKPPNSVENHHNGRYKISHGIGHLETYIDVPAWATEFNIKMVSDPTIDIIPWDNKPDSVRLEGNHLKSDYDLNGFPITLKIVGDPEDIAEGEYTLKFVDVRANTTIKKVELKGDREPPEDLNVDELEQEEAEEWGIEI